MDMFVQIAIKRIRFYGSYGDWRDGDGIRIVYPLVKDVECPMLCTKRREFLETERQKEEEMTLRSATRHASIEKEGRKGK
jgi:hypothetical protein